MKLMFTANKSLLVLLVFMVLLILGNSIRMSSHHYNSVGLSKEGGANGEEGHPYPKKPTRAREELGMELYPTGSSLPDCSHACGPCFPCKRVMVSFKCSTAESCPVVYRCMCKGKYYHVPSN